VAGRDRCRIGLFAETVAIGEWADNAAPDGWISSSKRRELVLIEAGRHARTFQPGDAWQIDFRWRDQLTGVGGFPSS
jgi:hypothetical protein